MCLLVGFISTVVFFFFFSVLSVIFVCVVLRDVACISLSAFVRLCRYVCVYVNFVCFDFICLLYVFCLFSCMYVCYLFFGRSHFAIIFLVNLTFLLLLS